MDVLIRCLFGRATLLQRPFCGPERAEISHQGTGATLVNKAAMSSHESRVGTCGGRLVLLCSGDVDARVKPVSIRGLSCGSLRDTRGAEDVA